MFAVLQKEECNFRVVNRGSIEYADLLLSGYSEVYFGTKRKCTEYVENVCIDELN